MQLENIVFEATLQKSYHPDPEFEGPGFFFWFYNSEFNQDLIFSGPQISHGESSKVVPSYLYNPAITDLWGFCTSYAKTHFTESDCPEQWSWYQTPLDSLFYYNPAKFNSLIPLAFAFLLARKDQGGKVSV